MAPQELELQEVLKAKAATGPATGPASGCILFGVKINMKQLGVGEHGRCWASAFTFFFSEVMHVSVGVVIPSIK